MDLHHSRQPFNSGGRSKRSVRGRHVRHSSEPPSAEDIGVVMVGMKSPGDLRGLFAEKQRSTSGVAPVSRAASVGGKRPYASPSCSITDITQFQESWSNVSSTEFLGGGHDGSVSGLSVLSTITPQTSSRSLVGQTASGFLHPLELTRRQSSASSASPMRLDSAGVASIIHDAARITDWDKVLSLCASNPEAAAYVGRDGWTALHHACNRRCPHANVAEALIRAYPDALLKEEDKGWLPLHYACRFKAPKEVVRLLLHMYPDKGRAAVSRRERMGRTPLYYAVRYDAPPGVVGLLLEVDPSAVLSEDQMEDSPLALVWNSWAEKLEGKRIIHSFLPGGFPEPEAMTIDESAARLRERLRAEPKLLKRWEKVNMFLKAAFGFPVEDDDDTTESKKPGASVQGGGENSVPSPSSQRKWRIVHATAAVKCHLSLFMLACALHPEQAREMDESDLRRPGDPFTPGSSNHQTALHLAASSNVGGEPGKTVIITLLSLHREAAQVQDHVDGSLPLHRMVENPCKLDWPTHTALLYHFYPQAVQKPDWMGRYPLHRAAAAIKHVDHDDDADEDNEGIERSVVVQLVRAFPQAASQVDKEGCLPMHMIAMNGEIWDDDVEAVFNACRPCVHSRAGPTWKNRLPLHMAAASPKSKERLVERLVQLNPRGASLVDSHGMLPLHLACEIGKDWDSGIRCLHEAFPGAVSIPEDNQRHWFALHMAAASSLSGAVLIKKLLELHPPAASVVDRDGRYPLHLACGVGKGWKAGLQLLLEANPSATLTADKNGLLPFHVAAFHVVDSCQWKNPVDDHDHINEVSDADSKETDEDEALEGDEEEAECVDTLFHLLRSDPTMLRVAVLP